MSLITLVKDLEQSFKKASIVSRCILLSYINAHEINIEALEHYLGPSSSKILSGSQGGSLYVVTKKRLRQLFRKFTSIHDAKREHAVTTGVLCLESSHVLLGVVKLKEECIEAFKLCNICQDLATYIDTLNDLYHRGKLSIKLSEAKMLFPTPRPELNTYEVLYLLTILMPAVLKLVYRGLDIHSYIVENFEVLQTKASQLGKKKGSSLVLRLFQIALSSLNANVEDLELIIYSSLIKYRIPLEQVYKAVEKAYWRYIAEFYKKSGRIIITVALQDLKPLIEQELNALGYLMPPLSEIFTYLKNIEALEISEHGRSYVHVGLPDYRPQIPIPLEFYKPRNVDIKDIEQLEIPLTVLKSYWQLG